MKLKLDLHDVYNRGADIDRALRQIIDEAVAKKAPLVEMVPGKGSGQLKKHVLRFLDQKEIRALYHRVRRTRKLRPRLRPLPLEVPNIPGTATLGSLADGTHRLPPVTTTRFRSWIE